MIKIERSYPAPASLERERLKKSGSYKQKDVVDQLERDFHGKCYICEMKTADPQVEHLLPHKNGKYQDREFDWDNLFLSCPHCNQVKNKSKYDDGIIDCCKVDPEDVMSFQLNANSVYVVVKKKDDLAVKRTAELVEEVFHSMNTGCLKVGSEFRLHKLQHEMNVFYSALNMYRRNPNSMFIKCALEGMLDRKSEFAGFKRSYIRLHKEDYPQVYSLLD